MIPPCQIVWLWLVGAGHLFQNQNGQPADWRSTFSKTTDDPANFVTVYDAAGVIDGRYMETGEMVEHYGIQIRVRSLKYKDGYTKAKELLKAMTQEMIHVPVIQDGSYMIESFTQTSSILSIGTDEKNRRENFTFNGIVTINTEG